MNETRALATFLSELTYDTVSPEAIQLTKNVIIDWLGVAIAGAYETPAKLLRHAIMPHDYGVEATVLALPDELENRNRDIDRGGSLGDVTYKGSALNAAFANGAASHTLDFDDLHNASIVHLATVVVPPALAVAEKTGVDGKTLITAIIAGYELGARVGESILPEAYFFWHSTGTVGTFAATAAASKVLDLDAEQTLQAIGSAGTQAAGLWDFLCDGAMSKPLHTAKACYGGVLSAYLGESGYTASSTILEGTKGFCNAMTTEPNLNLLTANLGEDFKIAHNSFKPYPCCKHSHAAVYGVYKILSDKNLTYNDIEKIIIKVNGITDSLINNEEPRTPYGCKFSIQYCVAALAVNKHLTITDFREDAINNPVVRELMKKVEVIFDNDMDAVVKEHPEQLASTVILVTKNNKEYEVFVPNPKGDPENPMSYDELSEKFHSLTDSLIGRKRAQVLIERVRNLEQMKNIRELLN